MLAASGSLLHVKNLDVVQIISPVTGPKRFSASTRPFSASDSPPSSPPALAESEANVVLLLSSVYLVLNPDAHGTYLRLLNLRL